MNTLKNEKSRLPNEPSLDKPSNRPLNAATERLYDKWGLYQDSTNEFYTNFFYSEVTGIGKEKGVTRRDPTTVLKIGDTYYVWYTRRKTEHERDFFNKPSAGRTQRWDVPVFDWDLAEIWYATSKDGFHWEEQGLAVTRGASDAFDGRTICTPDVLMANGKYYLYYQAVAYPYTIRSQNLIGMAWAESPDGPWHRWEDPILIPGEAGEWIDDDDSNNVKVYGTWDSHKLHDPFVLIRNGQVYLYYKGQPMGWGTKYDRSIGWGVAIADKPEGPFLKSPLNPITNSGHETCLFPYRKGILAICGHDGPEKDTVQYAPDGLNFEVVSHVVLPPPAPGPFAPDSYNDTKDGKGITWGLAHIATEETKTGNSYIIRFECNLRQGLERVGFRQTNLHFSENVYFSPDIVFNEENKKEKTYHPVEPEKPSEAIPAENVSAAMQRVYDTYGIYKDRESEFFSAFKYSRLDGLDKEDGITRRDPSKVIQVDDTYYVWYTRRQTGQTWQGVDNATETRPAFDWDLAEIWYATSKDGFIWEEQGCAVRPGESGTYDDRSVFTPDILVHEGRYYLYYQVIQGLWKRRSIQEIGMSWADSPDGLWMRSSAPVLRVGENKGFTDESDNPDNIVDFGAWDSHKLHDPYLLKYQGKIWLYYKGVQFGKNYRHDLGIAWGVATADKPEGPFIKSEFNPITNSGHETFLYPFRQGIVAITSLEGSEKNTVQFAPDGLNFDVVGKISVPPIAAGPFIPDAFSDKGDGQGITWGLSHIFHDKNGKMQNSFLVRFDCSLHQGEDRADFYRRWNYRYPEEAYFSSSFCLTDAMKEEAIQMMNEYDTDTIDSKTNEIV